MRHFFLVAGLLAILAHGAVGQNPAPAPAPAPLPDSTRVPLPDSVRLPERGDTVATGRGRHGVSLPQDRASRAARDSVRARRNRPRPLMAVVEGFGVNVFLQRMNWWLRHADWADISLASWKSNLRYGWEWDIDQFQTNMFGHPYGGGFYFNAGRDNGLSFWGAAPLTFLGSTVWEYFGENGRPSLNDLYMTSFGGIVFGEIGHRLGGMVRYNRSRGLPRVAREVLAIPFDPVGGFNRIIRGEFLRHSADQDDRDRSPFSVDIQVGTRLAVDSGPARQRSLSGTIVADIGYGDAFSSGYRQPFDVFRVRLQFSPARGGINTARMRGRLYGRELTDTAAAMRHVFTVALKSEYLSGPAYKFGGQSLESGFVSDFKIGAHAHIQTEAYLEWLLLGGLDAPGDSLRVRAYDFGPGAGASAAATLVLSGHSLVSARWRFAYVHTVSGAKADHQTHFFSIEASAPLGNRWGAGAYAGWYHQRSIYSIGQSALLNYPEFRFYLTWHGHRGEVPREAVGGSAL